MLQLALLELAGSIASTLASLTPWQPSISKVRVMQLAKTIDEFLVSVSARLHVRWHTVANLHPPEATIQRHDNDMTTSQHNNTTTTTQFF